MNWYIISALQKKSKTEVLVSNDKLRLINDKNVHKNLNEGIKFMPWIKIPVSWVSLRMRK